MTPDQAKYKCELHIILYSLFNARVFVTEFINVLEKNYSEPVMNVMQSAGIIIQIQCAPI